MKTTLSVNGPPSTDRAAAVKEKNIVLCSRARILSSLSVKVRSKRCLFKLHSNLTGFFSLSSLVSVANLSTRSFSMVFVCPTKCDWPALADWLLKIRCTLMNMNPLIAAKQRHHLCSPPGQSRSGSVRDLVLGASVRLRTKTR